MTATAGPDTTLRRALHLATLGRVGEAVPLIRDLLAADPDSVPALQMLAYCQQLGGRYGDMLATAEHATALAPEDPMNHRQRSRALAGLGRSKRAVEAALDAHQLAPLDIRSELVLADALLAAGGTANIVAARAAAARGRALDPEDIDAYLTEGHAYRRMAEFGRARAAYRRALALEPDNPAALYWLGSLDSDRGRALRASPVLGDTVRAAPTDPAVLRAASLGARRALWLITDLASVPLLVTVILVGVCRENIGGPAGVVAALGVLLSGFCGVAALLRWRLGALSGPTRTLMRARLHRPTYSAAPARLVTMAVGGVLFALNPAPGAESGVESWAIPLIVWSLPILLLRARNWFAAEVYYALRRCWFRLASAGNRGDAARI